VPTPDLAHTLVSACQNAEISARTGLPPLMDFIRRSRLSVFGHIARLTQGTPAHNALHCQVGLASSRSFGRDWRRRPGRPRARWIDQLRNDTGSVPANLWRQAILRGHGGVTRRLELATRRRRRRRSSLAPGHLYRVFKRRQLTSALSHIHCESKKLGHCYFYSASA